MLKTECEMKNGLPVGFCAVDEAGKVHASTNKIEFGNWVFETTFDGKKIRKEFDHSGPAIEAFTVYVANMNDFLMQQEQVAKAADILGARAGETC